MLRQSIAVGVELAAPTADPMMLVFPVGMPIVHRIIVSSVGDVLVAEGTKNDARHRIAP
jgi:hypothetical protein